MDIGNGNIEGLAQQIDRARSDGRIDEENAILLHKPARQQWRHKQNTGSLACMQSDTRDSYGLAMMVGILVGMVPLAGFAAMVLHHFDIRGRLIFDTGLLASLIWHSDWALSEVPAMGERSFFATHVTPVFWLLSAISWVTPLGMAQFFAAFVGACQALFPLAVFWLLVHGFGMCRGRVLSIAPSLPVLFAYSGMAIAIVLYPHFKTLIAAVFILFAVAFNLWHAALAALLFLIGVAYPQDAGFNFLSASVLAGFLSSYYAFPFLVALFWPLLGVYPQDPAQPPPVGRFFITSELTFIGFRGHHNPGRMILPNAFCQPPPLARQAETDQEIQNILDALPLLSQMIVDNSVAARTPLAFTAADPLGLKFLPSPALPPTDTLVPFIAGCDAIHLRAVIKASALNHADLIPARACAFSAARRCAISPPAYHIFRKNKYEHPRSRTSPPSGYHASLTSPANRLPVG